MDSQLKIDFDKNKIDYQRKGISKKDLLARAVGIKSTGLRVLDLTAGLAIDAVHLARLGCQVTSLERNPQVFLLLQEAWAKTERSEIKSIRFIHADAQKYLFECAEKVKDDFDVIYYDPMYPEKKKKSLPRKEMQVFRDWVGDDLDADEVIEVGLKSLIRRFVIKRPLKSPLHKTSAEGFHAHLLKGTTVQYQIYTRGKNE